ncbi:DUF6932 family protein [Methanohalophilus euhalobius]|jgi:hypothetical protein|uniref:Uncharacterized protein n=1 Tax=Methanohalophilus euhalobius TaxID=51203 RepID=A0A314ZYJ0_9EURY|nr:hypothetical protein [Methanohalophilus euhalobius]PQV43203.1 hypothetical protein B0H22_103216 [Methanohalophilus euhalobius]RNI09241.1 hypothetical protein EDD83_04575 [Methanohalophilus euhalobius]
MIPDFDDNGNLPPGFISPPLKDFENCFVDDFPESGTRGSIFEGYLKYCSILSSLEIASLQWINGSFTTNKLHPNDIDLVTHIDAVKLDSDGRFFLFLKNELDHHRVKNIYKCDTYYIPLYPPDDPELYELTKEKIKYWSKWFSHDRQQNAKGLIEFDLSDDSFNLNNCRGGVDVD